MKKSLVILLLLVASIARGQDEKPKDLSSFRFLSSPFFFYNLPDSSVWIYKGQSYGWTQLDRAKDPWYLKMLSGQDTLILPIHKRDTLHLPVYKLKADSLSPSGYVTHFRLGHNLDSLLSTVYTRMYLDSILDTKQETLTLGTASQYIRGDLSLANFPDILSGADNWNSAYSWGNHATEGYLKSETDPTIYAWAKAAVKPVYSYSEVGAAPASTVSFPGFGITHELASYGDHTHSQYVTGTPWTSMGYLTLSSFTGYATQSWVTTRGYLTSEADPTVSSWAKSSVKPSYSYSEVGAAPAGTVSFPGFGSSHSLAAFGDHNHAGVYLPLGGGTLTGTLYGTNASFTSSISAADFCNSDIRLKNLIGPLKPSDFIKANFIEFHKYSFKADTTGTVRYGVVAQELEKTLPELIHTDERGIKSVNYIDLLILMVAQQREALSTLEKRIEILERNEK
jgi:hypothetical protein